MRAGALAAAVCLAAAASISASRAPADPPRTIAFDAPLTRATRLLVVSPHPDDAALAAGGLIQRVAAMRGAIHIVQMTSGDAFSKGLMAERRAAVVPTADDYRQYGATRERETIAAMRTLGVRRSQITFLGFPDDGLCVLESEQDARSPFESPYTKRRSPPSGEQVIRGASYRGDDVRQELERVISRFEPTLVLVPNPRDEHPDHCATHMFVRDALQDVARAGRRPPVVLHYLIHFRAWPLSLRPDAALEPPPSFPAEDGTWRTLALTPVEAERKQKALSAYRTQTAVIGDLVAAFTRASEVFLAGEPSPTPACWCGGENIATPVRAR
jgi:N-acetyl-1-D-myo-inositol-2-amino-2-deoxy-alpha-D-glucopyranoside deacetylase